MGNLPSARNLLESMTVAVALSATGCLLGIQWRFSITKVRGTMWQRRGSA